MLVKSTHRKEIQVGKWQSQNRKELFTYGNISSEDKKEGHFKT
jgi:hypothetical protein